jgi:MOSC domain-containing protein YiiM
MRFMGGQSRPTLLRYSGDVTAAGFAGLNKHVETLKQEMEEQKVAVEDIFVASIGGAAMERRAEVTVIEGRGLAGDRYLERRGYWTSVDECQVTLIEGEGLDEISARTDVAVSIGEHRRNIVTRGLPLHVLRGKRFRVGDALLEYDRPRPPCRYIQSVSQRGMTRALGRARGGICARVVEGGRIRVGDEITVVEGAPRRLGIW